jgi:hypothetical protein
MHGEQSRALVSTIEGSNRRRDNSACVNPAGRIGAQ